MWNEEEIDELPDDDDEAAFIQFVRKARSRAEEGIDRGNGVVSYVIGYCSDVRAAAAAYEFEALAELRAPDPADNDLIDQYHRITAQVDAFVLQLQLMRKRNPRTYSVALDAAAKTKIHHFIGQIRAEIEAADLDEAKRNELFDKLHDLAREVDKSRTQFQRTMSALMVVAPVVDRGARIVGKILGVFQEAKEDEERVLKSLSAPKPKLKLPAPSQPKRPPLRETFNQDLDDEIPF